MPGGTGHLPSVSFSRLNYISTENNKSVARGVYCRISGLVLCLLLAISMGAAQAQDPGLVLGQSTARLSLDDVDLVYKGGAGQPGAVVVPVRIAGSHDANFVQLSVDYDRSRLSFRELRIEYGRWILWPGIPVVNNPNGRVVATLFDLGGGSRPAPGEPGLHFASLVFDLVGGDFPADNYVVRTPLEFTSFNPQSLSNDPRAETVAGNLDVENQDLFVRALPTEVNNGGVNVYYANAVEVGGGGVTHIEQSVVLPLYVTQLSDIDFIGVGVDYDELILNLAAVRPMGHPGGEVSDPVEVIHRSNPPGADFRLDLRGLGQSGTGHLVRRHVADLVFNYSGPGEAGDGMGQGGFGNHVGGSLVIQPSLGRNAGQGVAAETDGHIFLSGYLEILQPHFVRGNVDSSVLNYQAPENGNAIAGDSYRTAPDLGDPTAILRWLFWPEEGVQNIRCMEAADVNDDGAVQIDDAVLLLTTLFIGGAEPAAPYPYPGADPEGSPSSLGCEHPLPVFMGN